MNDSVDRLAKALADRYNIEKELGQGGMATVYLAEDLKHVGPDDQHFYFVKDPAAALNELVFVLNVFEELKAIARN